MITRDKETGELKINRLGLEIFIDDIVSLCKTESECEYLRSNILEYFKVILDNKIDDILNEEQ